MNKLPEIEAVMQNYCADKIAAAKVIDYRYAELWTIIGKYLAAGGKRMRPRLVLMTYDAYNTSQRNDITPVAAAWELLHACLLVHDDIIDRDTMRHGVPNIAGTYEAIYGAFASDTSHYALSSALLGGDLLLMSTYEMVNKADISSDQKLMVQSYINKALFTVAGGELIDTVATLYPVSENNPQAVAASKTASYSLQLPMQCGAALAGTPSSELDKLSEAGLHLGIAYQLRDDLLGVFGDSKTTGKSNRSDIIEKKRTSLIHAAIASLDSVNANQLVDLFSKDRILTDTESEHAVELIIESGAKEKIELQIENETLSAIEVISSLNVQEHYKESFIGIANMLTARTH